MPDFVKLNGTAVRTTGSYRRKINQDAGPPLDEIEVVIIVRGSMANRSLKQLLSTETVQVDVPAGGGWDSFEAAIEHVNVQSSGTGEAAAYRFDLTLRELPESADIRAEHAKAVAAEAPPPVAIERVVVEAPEPVSVELSSVRVSSDSSSWASALQQLKTPPSARPAAPPEPPLTALERTGIEAILVNLRMDALIDQLEAAGFLQGFAVERAFMLLVKERFVLEATPVVGEKIARRAERDLLG